jgi:hypothetical protein
MKNIYSVSDKLLFNSFNVDTKGYKIQSYPKIDLKSVHEPNLKDWYRIVVYKSFKIEVFYGNNPNPIVTIDFINQRVIVHYNQEGFSQYPILNEEFNTITLLGDYKIFGVRQEVVIGFDFTNQTVTILEEESPYNVCSNLGASSKLALICLPNAIRVEFSRADVDFVM